MGNLITIAGRMNCVLSLAGRKFKWFYPFLGSDFIPKFYLYQLWGRVTSFELLSKYLLIMLLRFDMMLYSSLSNEYSGAGLIKCLRGPQVPHPCAKTSLHSAWSCLSIYQFGLQFWTDVCLAGLFLQLLLGHYSAWIGYHREQNYTEIVLKHVF